MRTILLAAAAVTLLGSLPAVAQTRLDHDVQRAWDNTFNPGPRGDPRTNWERRREDRAAYERRQGERMEWCRYHPGACR